MKILPYILNITASLILAFTIYLVKKISADHKEECDSQKAVANGIQSILRDRILQKSDYHIRQGYCSSDDKTVLEKMYKPYSALKGNDVAEKAYNHAMELPEFKEDEKK